MKKSYTLMKMTASNKKIISVILIFLIYFFAVQGVFSQDENWFYDKPIRDIIFQGLRNIQSSELEALMNPYRGQLFSDTVYFEILGKLYALEYFDSIDPSTSRANADGTEVVILFTVIEKPVVRRINFIGNTGVRRHELNEAIFTKVSDIFNQARLRADLEAIRQKYMEKGYPNATVTVEEIIANDGVTLNFRIVESEKISIIRIDFQGNTRFSSNTLRNQLSLRARSRIRDGAFQEAKLIEDRAAITKYYHDRGFIDMVVRDVTRVYGTDDRGTSLILTFMIEEGEEFRFGGITFEGNRIFSTEQLERLVTSKVGDIVNASRIEMDLQRVADLYFENGYIFNSMNRQIEKNNTTNTFSIHFQIIERNRAYIENVIVIGNEKTKPHVIFREIPLEPGDVFSKTKVMDAMRNLYNLQYFSMVIPDTLQGSEESLMDLVFTVEEQMTTTIQFGITFSGSPDPETFPISGMFEWTDKNLAGSGNELSASINASLDTGSVSLNYLHRWVFGLPLSLGIDLSASYSKRLATTDNFHLWEGDEPYAFPDGFSNWTQYNDNNRLPPREFMMDYEQWYLSLGFSTGYRWITQLGILGLSGSIRFGTIRNSYDEILNPFDKVLRENNNEWIPRNLLSMSFSLDQRDIFYDPSRGYFFNQRAGIYGFLNQETEKYIRTDTRFQFFHTLFDIPVTETWNFKGVFAFNTSVSFILPQPWRSIETHNINVAEASQLSVDGMFVGRGWVGEYRTKGNFLWDNWIELRFPIVRGVLAFDLFGDAAGVESTPGEYFWNNNFKLSNLRFGYGGGFRFTIPQFPIRISVVKRFLFKEDESGNYKLEWQPGMLFGSNDPFHGVDIQLSFALSY